MWCILENTEKCNYQVNEIQLYEQHELHLAKRECMGRLQYEWLDDSFGTSRKVEGIHFPANLNQPTRNSNYKMDKSSGLTLFL